MNLLFVNKMQTNKSKPTSHKYRKVIYVPIDNSPSIINYTNLEQPSLFKVKPSLVNVSGTDTQLDVLDAELLLKFKPKSDIKSNLVNASLDSQSTTQSIIDYFETIKSVNKDWSEDD